MLCTSSLDQSSSHLNKILTGASSQVCHSTLNICRFRVPFPQSCSRCSPACLLQRETVPVEREGNGKEEESLKWHNVRPNLTEAHKHAISQISPSMTNRCKAVMRRIISFCPYEENLFRLLASWVKAMKPRRCDWLSILKEIKRLQIPLLFEVMEYALAEESFEANVRDYTKLIDSYAKHDRLHDADNAFQSMRMRGFPCDQVTLTVLIQMYSKAGDLRQAEEAFEEIKVLNVPMDKRAYGSMVMAYIRAKNLDLAESLLKEMEAGQVFAGKEIYKAMLRAYSMAGDADGAQRVFDAVQFAGIVPGSRTCALLVNAYCMAGKTEEARSTIENMRAAGLDPNDKCIALMLGAYRKENELEKALDFLMNLERGGVLIEGEASEVLAQWFRGLGVVNELELALRDFLEVKGGRKLASS